MIKKAHLVVELKKLHLKTFIIIEPGQEITNNVLCVTSKASYQPAHMRSLISFCYSLEYSTIVKQLTEHHLKALSLKVGCTGLPESTLVKVPHCWKSHVTANIYLVKVCFWCKLGHTFLTYSNLVLNQPALPAHP